MRFFFLDEVIGFAQVLGFFLILVGVFFGSGAYEEMRRKRRLKQA